MSALCHMSNWHGVVGLCSTRVNYGGWQIWPGYVCILPHVKLTWCSRSLYISSEGTLHLKIWGHSALGHQMSLLGVHLIWGYTSSERMNSICSVHFISKDDLILLCTHHLKRWPNSAFGHQMSLWGVHLIWVYTSSENMRSFRVWVLHHRCLFYKRPTRLGMATMLTLL